MRIHNKEQLEIGIITPNKVAKEIETKINPEKIPGYEWRYIKETDTEGYHQTNIPYKCNVLP